MNILIKLTCLIGLVVAPILGGHSSEDNQNLGIQIEEIIEIEQTEGNMAKATIITTFMENGEEKEKKQTIEGTVEEVEAIVEAMKGEGVHGKHHFKLDKSKGEVSKSVSIETEEKK